MGLFSVAQQLLYPIYGAMQKLRSGNAVRCTLESKGRVTLYSENLASGNLAELAFDIPSMAARAGKTKASAKALVDEMSKGTGQPVNIDPNQRWPRVGFATIDHVHLVIEKLSAYLQLVNAGAKTMVVGRSMQVSAAVCFLNTNDAEIRPVYQKDRDTGIYSYRVYPTGGNEKQEDLKIVSHEDLARHARLGSSIRCLLPSGARSNRSLKSKDVIGLLVDEEHISSPATPQFPDQRRLRVEQLRQVTAEYIWMAVQCLLAGEQATDFGASVDYDLLAEGGVRLAPKQVFGLAASNAFGFRVKPWHFTAGVGTTCFGLLEGAGYRIVSKGEVLEPIDLPVDPNEMEWAEGRPRLVNHYRRERATGLAKAKKAEFVKRHGRLVCESCNFDPSTQYGDFADACIEVHHDAVHVSEMPANHRTTLEHLKCLCANCHRVAHRQIAMNAPD